MVPVLFMHSEHITHIKLNSMHVHKNSEICHDFHTNSYSHFPGNMTLLLIEALYDLVVHVQHNRATELHCGTWNKTIE